MRWGEGGGRRSWWRGKSGDVRRRGRGGGGVFVVDGDLEEEELLFGEIDFKEEREKGRKSEFLVFVFFWRSAPLPLLFSFAL